MKRKAWKNKDKKTQKNFQTNNWELWQLEESTVPRYHHYTTNNYSLKNNNNSKDVDPLNLKSDKHLISPYNITPESHIKVMRIKETIIN